MSSQKESNKIIKRKIKNRVAETKYRIEYPQIDKINLVTGGRFAKNRQNTPFMPDFASLNYTKFAFCIIGDIVQWRVPSMGVSSDRIILSLKLKRQLIGFADVIESPAGA